MGSGTASNSMPFTGLDLDLLAATDAGLDKKVYNGVDITSTDSDFFNMNWYSVVSVDLIEGENRDTREVSRIQHYQLSLVNDAASHRFKFLMGIIFIMISHCYRTDYGIDNLSFFFSFYVYRRKTINTASFKKKKKNNPL